MIGASVAGEGENVGLSGCACTKLRRLTRHVTQLYDEALAPVGVTVTQYSVLANLDRSPEPLAIGALAGILGMDPTTLTRTLKPLEQRALVEVGLDPQDRRVRRVALTASGRDAVLVARPRWREAQERLEAALGPETTGALVDLLDRSSRRLSTAAR